MALRLLAPCAALAAALLAAPALGAEEPSDAEPSDADAGALESADAGPTEDVPAPAAEPGAIVPPQASGPISIPYPPEAPPRTEPAEVKVLLTIGPDGAVSEVKLVAGAGEPFDAAVLEAAKAFQFKPATLGGKPVAVVVPFSQTFVPPVVVTQAAGQRLDSQVEGIVVERGTRKPVSMATVAIQDAQGERTTATDDKGVFSVQVAAGDVRVQIAGPGLRPFVRLEKLKPNEMLKVKYLVDRESYNPYESVVIGTRDRTEIARTTLSGREIHQLPGTFGDPFRVVAELPGVSQVMSLLPMPIVRGTSPGDTGVFLDGVRLPLLFHLFGGPSVIHPEFIDKVDFYPGGFPVSYGGYIGGIIDGQTARPREGESKIDLDLNLTQVGAFVREPIPGTSLVATVAGRYGYPGLLLSLLTSNVSLSYWDYQARLDGGSPHNNWTVFFFGARDQVSTAASTTPGATSASSALTTQGLFMFHRADLRWHLGDEATNFNARLILGYDNTQAVGDQIATHSYFFEPQISGMLPITDWLRLHAGGDLLVRNVPGQAETIAVNDQIQLATSLVQTGWVLNGGLFLEAPIKLWDRLMIVPGVRGDVYRDDTATKWSFDPRLTVRFRPTPALDLWLKGLVGRYHQPPRVFVAVPGMDQSSLNLGLLASTQYGLGAEATLLPGLELDVQGYYNDMNPVVFDLQVNQQIGDVQPSAPSGLPGQLPVETTSPGFVDRLFQQQVGRSYGLEILLRKRDTHGVFGWIAYTLSSSQRKSDTQPWAAYDFDRTHIFNAVVGVRLPRNWELGARLLVQSGTPLTTVYGYNAGRSGAEFRIDIRVDKRAIWNSWMLDFYADIINSTVAEDTGGLLGGASIRYVLPTIGIRAVL